MSLGFKLVLAGAAVTLATQVIGVGSDVGSDSSGGSSKVAVERASELIGFSSAASDGGQHVTLVDAPRRVMSVYHVDGQTGKITLRSVRRLAWDFAIDDYNAAAPLPEEIRQMVDR